MSGMNKKRRIFLSVLYSFRIYFYLDPNIFKVCHHHSVSRRTILRLSFIKISLHQTNDKKVIQASLIKILCLIKMVMSGRSVL